MCCNTEGKRSFIDTVEMSYLTKTIFAGLLIKEQKKILQALIFTKEKKLQNANNGSENRDEYNNSIITSKPTL